MRGALLLCLSGLFLTSCRTDKPPAIEICTLDGFGGGDCVVPAVGKVYRAPSEMKNYWATSQLGMSAFSAWCYDTSTSTADVGLNQLLTQIREDHYADLELRVQQAPK